MRILDLNRYSVVLVFPDVAKNLKYNKGILMKKIMVGNAPPSLSRLFLINPTWDQIKINIPTPCIDLFKTSLTFSGVSLWNSLPYSLKIQSSKLFKKRYLSYLTSLPWLASTKFCFVQFVLVGFFLFPFFFFFFLVKIHWLYPHNLTKSLY